MIETIYLEQDIQGHDRVREIIERFPKATVIPCQHYGEILNRKAQNFRLQKSKPALVLSQKQKGLVLPAPAAYGLGSANNYYFSHMLNCLYDCRYCFLQGMYRSAHYILFVNYEDFVADIKQTLARHGGQDVYFYSGYDCDSLALEPVSHFAEYFLPFFRQHPNAIIEFRTKSTQVRYFLDQEPMENVILAFSFTPAELSQALEHKVPALEKRLQAMVKLQQQGWSLGLRFDPLIYTDNYRHFYREMFQQIFSRLQADSLHSVSYGSFRMPEVYFQNSVKLYPYEKLFAGPLEKKQGMVAYAGDLEDELMAFCRDNLLQYVTPDKLYACEY